MQTSGSMRRRVGLSGVIARSWRPSGPRIRALIRSIATSYIALGITLYILPGRQSSGPLPVFWLVLVVAVVGVLLRPVLLGLAVIFGSFGLLIVGVLTQAIILDVAIGIAPDVRIGSRPEILIVSWVAATIAAIVNWLFDAGNEDSFLAQLLGRAVRVAHRQRRISGPTGRGTLIVQLDGVGADLLRQAIVAGAVPTLSSWLRSGSHRMRHWHTGLPATTPAGQAVLLYGDVTQIPSFRWYEKPAGRLMVANHPRDAAELERRLSTGDGLLSDGGVSISNLFCGDAPSTLLTMSDARLPARDTHGLASFATARGGLVRSIVVFVGQVITELYQGRRQRRRGVQPRVRRGWVFALLRAVTTALLRDLNVALVAEQIARGAPVIFVDFLDYDEVAHHAGPSRPESMRTLDGLDRLLRFFADVIVATDRAYDVVVVSDHGQAQGDTFEQLAGQSLHELVAELTDEPARPTQPVMSGQDSAPAERWGPANLLLTGIARSRGRLGRRMTKSRRTAGESAGEEQVTLGGQAVEPTPEHPTPLVVAASGSLAHIYLADEPGRVGREVIDARHPRLIAGLAASREIGAVLVRAENALLVFGALGWRILRDGAAVGGEGVDPLESYGEHAAADLIQLDQRQHVGDLVALGRYDPRTGQVVAFEELVGSHGGLGGGQTEAIFLHPTEWSVPEHAGAAPSISVPARPGSTALPPLTGVEVHEVLRAHVPRSSDDAVNTFPLPEEAPRHRGAVVR